MQQTKKKTHHHEIYRKLSHSQRINFIYSHKVLKIPISRLSRDLGVSYSSIRNVIEAYKSSGRTNKMNCNTIFINNSVTSIPAQKSLGFHNTESSSDDSSLYRPLGEGMRRCLAAKIKVS